VRRQTLAVVAVTLLMASSSWAFDPDDVQTVFDTR